MATPVATIKKTKNAQYRIVAQSDRPRGGWGESKIEIFILEGSKSTLIGGYTRNYAAFAAETLYPFSRGNRDYALFSPDYTCTRIMELPSCRDIGGEERSSAGFCPVDYCVPDIYVSESSTRESEIGFVAGCVWGDDSSWKVECLDLKRVTEGVLKRDSRLGYFELPNKINLQDAILGMKETKDGDIVKVQLRIAGINTFDVLSGKPMSYDPFE